MGSDADAKYNNTTGHMTEQTLSDVDSKSARGHVHHRIYGSQS